MKALDLYFSQQPLDNGKMTAMIWYRNPYLIKKRDSFFRGNDALFRCVIRLSSLFGLCGLIDLVK